MDGAARYPRRMLANRFFLQASVFCTRFIIVLLFDGAAYDCLSVRSRSRMDVAEERPAAKDSKHNGSLIVEFEAHWVRGVRAPEE